MSCHCERNDMSTLVVDSGVYYGVLYARDYLIRSLGSGMAYSSSEKLWKTGVFAAASAAWDSLLPESFYDAFMYAGDKIATDGMCAYCQARNIYIVFVQFLVDWFRYGMGRTSDALWEGLDEFIRLSVTDYTAANWVRPALLSNMSMLRRPSVGQMLPGVMKTGTYNATF